MKKFLFSIKFLMILLSAQAQKVTYQMLMRMDGSHKLYTGEITNTWGFSFLNSEGSKGRPGIPAPTLTATEGDTVVVTVYNPSDEGHTIHWHGLDVDQANDGVPHTSQFVLHGDTFVYTFVAPHAGNYIYHCHVTTTLHLMMGMYGSFIVYPKSNKKMLFEGGPSFENEYTFLGSELNKNWTDDYMSGGALNEFYPTHFMLSGKEKTQLFEDSTSIINLQKGKNTLLRLLNIGFSIDKYTFPEDVIALVYSSDGRALKSPFLAKTLELYPGERYGVILNSNNNITNQYITVDYLNMYEKQQESRNYIGINTTNFPTSLFEVNTSTENFFPNPTSGNIYFENIQQSIKIFDLTGKLLLEAKQSNFVSLKNLPNGVYLVEFEDGKEMLRKKVVKF